MDDLYHTFEPRAYASKKRDASLRIAQQPAACCKLSYIIRNTGVWTQAMSLMPPHPPTVPLVLLENIANIVTEDNMNSLQRRRNFCIITLDGDDLSFIGNVKKDDTIKLRRFEFTSTKELIWKAWCNMLFIPVNRMCLEHLN